MLGKGLKSNGPKRAMAFVLAGALFLGNLYFVPTESVQAASINMGVENHWAEPFMLNMYNRGLMSGDKNGNMHPDRPITRAEFVSIINRAFGYTSTGKNPFKDVTGTEWYADDITVAYNQGYFSGDSKSVANPTASLTREQAISLLGRNLKIEEISGVNQSFADGKKVSTWSRGYVNAATEKGYISGYNDNTFRAQNYISRAEVAKVLTDALGELVSSSGTKYLGTQKGNVTVASSGVTIKDTIINGDLYITDGVGLGHTYFDNVHVLGDVIIAGSGESNAGNSSITFNDSTITELIVDGTKDNIKSIKLSGNTIVDHTTIKTTTYLEETSSRGGGFQEVVLNGPEDTSLYLSGLFDQVTIEGVENHLYLSKETIRDLIIDEAATGSTVFLDTDTYVDNLYMDAGIEVSGRGEIGYLKVNASDAVVTMLPDEIEIRPGLTAEINGNEMTSKDAEESSDDPEILSDYPEVVDIGPADGVATFKVNKPGTIYWTVTYYEDGRPSQDDIVEPGKYNTEIIKSGSLSVASDKEYTAKVSGLEQDTDYILSAVLVDERDERSDREVDYFSTLDQRKPAFVTGYPFVSEVADESATLDYVTDKDATMYWAVYDKGRPAPDAKSLKAQNLFGTVAKGVEEDCTSYVEDTFSVAGLEELTNYDCYILLSDGSNDSAVTKIQVATKDATPPEFRSNYPRLTASEATSAEVSLNLNEQGIVYYAMYIGGTSFPVQEQVDIEAPLITSDEAKQQIVKGLGAEKTGKSGTLKPDTPTPVKFTGLTAEEQYDVYFVAQDTSGNYSEIKKVTIEPKPGFTKGYPEVLTLTNISADIAINVTKDVVAYWAVLPSGSVAPNINALKTQVVSGATNKGIIEECKKNETYTLTVDGLKETVGYDFYVFVTDGFKNSEVSKLTFTTVDLTAPVFSNGYPKKDTIKDKSIDITAKVNEASTIFYVLCAMDEEFPHVVPPATEVPALDSDEAKEQVVLGDGGIKNGKVTAQKNTETKISLTGLAAETAYKLYLVARDTSNNTSSVVYMDVKTADYSAPTATLEFEDMISGDVTTDSQIRIIFSEEVLDYASKEKLTDVDKSKLSANIALYDLSSVKRTPLEIDYESVLVEYIDGHTIVTFPQGLLGLSSATAYEFELNKIVDTSGNRMAEKTLLPSFTTAAPLVEIVETVPASDLDLTFRLTPQITEANENIYYDVLFESNTKIGFEVYEKPFGATSFTKIASDDGTLTTAIVEAGASISLQNIKDKVFDDLTSYQYSTFKSLEETEYGIKIVSINGDTERKGWENTVDIDVKCVIGGISGLTPVSDNPTARLEASISEGKVMVVNYPKEFSMRIYFTDTVIPDFLTGYPKLGASQVGDVLIRPIVNTTKKGTFYYLVAKKGSITNPTADGIMNGKYKPQDGVYGSFSVDSGYMEYEFRIEGLTSETDYVMYCFMKGAPTTTSEMKTIDFTTVAVEPPNWTGSSIRDRLEGSAVIDVALDKASTVDWILFSQTSAPTNVTADIIRKREEASTYKPIDFGTTTATISNGDSVARATITVYNMERDVYYNFYAVAKGNLGGADSTILKVEGITPADRTAPTVEVKTSISNPNATNSPYSGYVYITFNEPIYYIQGEGAQLKALDTAVLKDWIDANYGTGDSDAPKVEIVTAARASTGAVTTVTLKFSNVYHNTSVRFLNYKLSDINTNVSGYLDMTFVDMQAKGGIRADSYWNNQFTS